MFRVGAVSMKAAACGVRSHHVWPRSEHIYQQCPRRNWYSVHQFFHAPVGLDAGWPDILAKLTEMPTS